MCEVTYVSLMSPLVGTTLLQKTQKCFQLLEQLRNQVHSRKTKRVDILSLSQEVRQSITPTTHTHVPSSSGVPHSRWWTCDKL